MSVIDKLAQIQQRLAAPKDQFNSFGKYSYRSAESILQSVKPLLAETKTVLVLDDEVTEIGGRVYVKATAKLYDLGTKESISSVAYAREEESKKGMDGSQVTGASSSYARKYAMSGLFAIDDNKDSDATNIGEQKKKPAREPQEAPDGYYYCQNCGDAISAVTMKNGQVMSPKDMARYTLGRFNRQLCKACCENEKQTG